MTDTDLNLEPLCNAPTDLADAMCAYRLELDGASYRVTLCDDALYMGAPWEEGDCLGVPDLRRADHDRPYTAPDEIVLYSGNDGAWIYDKGQAIRDQRKLIAQHPQTDRRINPHGLTAGQLAVQAVDTEIEYFRKWLDGDWRYVRVVVDLLKDSSDGFDRIDADDIVDGASAGIGAVESDSFEWVVRDLADEALRNRPLPDLGAPQPELAL